MSLRWGGERGVVGGVLLWQRLYKRGREGTTGTDSASTASPWLLDRVDPQIEEPIPESKEREYLWFDLGDLGGSGDSLSFDVCFGETRIVQLLVRVRLSWGGLTSICIGGPAAGRFTKQRRGEGGNLLPAGLGSGSRDGLIAAVALGRDV